MAKPWGANAQWSTKNSEITAGTDASGTWTATVPLYDGTVKTLTFIFSITADRRLRLDVHGEEGADPLVGFEAWSGF